MLTSVLRLHIHIPGYHSKYTHQLDVYTRYARSGRCASQRLLEKVCVYSQQAGGEKEI